MEGDSWQSIGLTGKEKITFEGLADLQPRQTIQMHVRFEDGTERSVPLLVRIDTADELDYYRHGGILPYVLRNLVSTAA
jgi:aconitate hydratase